jgi:hypothetical protein
MMDTSRYPRWLCLACLGGLAILAGCGPKNYKQDADKKVYDIIDRTWTPEHGMKANYKISDVEPSPYDIRADRSIPVSGVLTLQEAVAVATAHNRDYQLQKDLLYATALDQRLVRHGYEWQLFGGGNAFYSKSESAKGKTEETVSVEGNVGFNRLLANGALVSSRIGARWLDALLGFRESGLSSILGASVAVPLLRGSDPKVVLEPLTQAERNTLYQIRTFNRFRKTFVVSVITQYYGVLESYEVAQNTYDYHRDLEKLSTQVERLVSVGRLPAEELDRVRQEILRARDTYILAKNEYSRLLDQYKITLGVPPTTEFTLDEGVFDTLAARGLPRPDFALDEAIEAALSRRLDVVNSADVVLDAQRAVYVARDALGPGLAVVGAVDIDTRGAPKDIVAGPVLDVPLDRVPEQGIYRKALILLSQRQREYDLAADTVRLEVREAHRKLTEAAERYEVLSEGLKLARERIRKTSVLLEYTRVSSRRVLDAEQHLHNARNEATDALVDYAVATLHFYRDTDVLQVRPDGMWEIGPSATPVAKTASNAAPSLTRE